MRFTYRAYEEMLRLLRDGGYKFANYFNWREKGRCVILRHDIDENLAMAHRLASFERDGGVKSTYFVILTSDLYNVFSPSNRKLLEGIADFGHEIGLHFDEAAHPDIVGDEYGIREKIEWETRILGEAIGRKVRVVSMHRPSKAILEANLVIPDIVNSYGRIYFKDFKYLSDSRCRWRESVEDIIASGRYDKLHILTHAFWYHDGEQDIRETVREFVNHANMERWHHLKGNISNLDEVMGSGEVF